MLSGMQTINQLYFDAVEYEQFYLAYALFIAAKHGIIKFSDPVQQLNYDKFPHESIQQACQKDELRLIADSVKLYLLKRQEGDWALYLSKRQQDAVALHVHMFGEQPLRIVNNTVKMDSSIWDPERKRYISFREIKKQTTVFPTFLFLMDGRR